MQGSSCATGEPLRLLLPHALASGGCAAWRVLRLELVAGTQGVEGKRRGVMNVLCNVPSAVCRDGVAMHLHLPYRRMLQHSAASGDLPLLTACVGSVGSHRMGNWVAVTRDPFTSPFTCCCSAWISLMHRPSQAKLSTAPVFLMAVWAMQE